jgi:hypothetical protein
MKHEEWLEDLSPDKRRNIFLNIPYVPSFLNIEVVYWTTLTFFGLKPVFASDFRPTGERLNKIDALLKRCDFGIADLSIAHRLGNIAFEMGYMVARGVRCQPFIDQRFHRRGGAKVIKFDEMLSDYKGVEAIVYDGDPEILIKKLCTWIHDNPGMRVRKRHRYQSATILQVCKSIERLVRDEDTPERAERYAKVKSMFSYFAKEATSLPTSSKKLHVKFTDHKIIIQSKLSSATRAEPRVRKPRRA